MGEGEADTSETRCYLCFAPNCEDGNCSKEVTHTAELQDVEALRDSWLDAQRG
jgi:hypothetical protein